MVLNIKIRICENNTKTDLKEIGRVGCGQDSSGSGWGSMADCCGHGNETSVSIKFVEFSEYMSWY
jgi:hypothetical protein